MVEGDEFIDQSVTLLKCPYGVLRNWTFECKGDPFWRLYWNDSPGAFARNGGQELGVVPTQLMVIPPETPFGARLENKVKHMHLTFLTRFSYKHKRIFTFPLSRETKQRLEILTAPAKGDSPNRIEQTFAANYLAYFALSQIPEDGFSHTVIDVRISRTIEYMKKHLDAVVTNEEFAAIANLNTNSYIRLFSESVGQSPQAYFTRLKMDHACVLLVNTHDSIENITAAIGYCDRYHFSKMFKKARKVSPVQYRDQMLPVTEE